MSIKVQEVSKLFGKQKALDTVNFEIHKGEVLGFLGPNGAGKSTMMKIITGFLPQTSGVVEVNGMNVETHSLEIRKQIGYLPEHNPLYLEMYVKEYLDYVASIYKVSNRKKRIAEMIEMTGLGLEQKKKIAALSKGYRQRVGIAQALIHDPSVVILDEPTTGLDPNQLIDIRNLIQEIGKEKTVMLSTHIMQEVEACCERALIINRGELVGDYQITENRIAQSNCFEVEFESAVSITYVQKINSIKKIEQLSENKFLIYSDEDIRKLLFQQAVDNNWVILEMKSQNKKLEDLFHEITQ